MYRGHSNTILCLQRFRQCFSHGILGAPLVMRSKPPNPPIAGWFHRKSPEKDGELGF